MATVVAWLWYSDGLTTSQIAFCAVILAGVVIGLLPYIRGSMKRPVLGGAGLKGVALKSVALGIGLALLAAAAQGISLAATRNGILMMAHAHTPPDVFTVSFQRLLGGFAVAVAVYAIARWLWHRKWGFNAADGSCKPVFGSEDGRLTSRPLLWGSLNSLLGPILAVTCTVWAQQTLPAGQVQSIAALAPLISVPFAYWLEGHKPPRFWYLGAGVAIVGLVLLDLNS